MRIAILGRTKMLFNVIEEIERQGKHQIVLIGTCKASPEYSIKEDDFEKAANRLKVPYFNTNRINSDEVMNMIRSSAPDVGLSMNWLTLIGEDVIKLFGKGILNAHPGDLPKYRGNACPNWAIVNGEKRIGVAVHYMTPGELDSGDIVEKQYLELDDEYNITKVYDRLETLIPNLFMNALEKISCDEFIADKQSNNPKDILRCYPRRPEDSFIEWNQSVERIQRLVNGSGYPFQDAYCYYNTYKILVRKCEIEYFKTPVLVVPGQVVMIDRVGNRIGIAAKDGIIILTDAVVEDEDMTVTELIVSVRSRLNYAIDDKIYELEKRVSEVEKKLNEYIGISE